MSAHRQTHLETARQSYRKRVVVERGLKKLEFPYANDGTTSKTDDEPKVAAPKSPETKKATRTSEKH
jgi:hypothetical protein